MIKQVVESPGAGKDQRKEKLPKTEIAILKWGGGMWNRAKSWMITQDYPRKRKMKSFTKDGNNLNKASHLVSFPKNVIQGATTTKMSHKVACYHFLSLGPESQHTHTLKKTLVRDQARWLTLFFKLIKPPSEVGQEASCSVPLLPTTMYKGQILLHT